MHKLPLIVFKTLGLSIILMFLLDTSLVVIETININSRVTNIAGVMQNEIARHNSMPSELQTLFDNQLGELIESSTVAKGYSTNMNEDLDPSTPLNYGDIATLEISVDMAPMRVYFSEIGAGGNQTRGSKDEGLLFEEEMQYTLDYTYQVPCLRYLK